MSIAAALNTQFTLGALRMVPAAPAEEPWPPGITVRKAPKALRHSIYKSSAAGWSEVRSQPAQTSPDLLRSAMLEYQHGMWRVFQPLTGWLLHSHEFKLEAVRRAERDGYQFNLHKEN